MARVIHFEIPAKDTQRAVAFYKKAFDWKIDKYGSEEMNYFLVSTGEDKEPGINGAIAEKDDLHPTTVNTISVVSVEDAAKKIKAAGGKVLGQKMAVPNVGYMAYCKDTEGNIFGIMQVDPKAK